MIKAKNRAQPLQIAIQGMDGRSFKTMVMFLQGPCKGSAVVVEDSEAEAEIVDVDSVNSKKLLESRRELHPERPIIVLSLQPLNLDGVVFVKKPVQSAQMQEAIELVRKTLDEQRKKNELLKRKLELSAATEKSQENSNRKVFVRDSKLENKALDDEKKQLNYEEQRKTSKHKAAMALDEGNFIAYIGSLGGINFNDLNQLTNASYNPKDYYQGYVQAAYNLSRSKGRIIRLHSGWKPVTIFPHSHEIWVDATDNQLRSFAAVSVRTIAGADGQGLSVKSVNPTDINSQDPEKFQSMEAFLWKLAIWTSKGRFPLGIDIHHPIYLRQWPNFTRLVITPHAMRIAALLMTGPRTLVDVARTLNIQPQYVFVFFSAAYALGLARQSERKADEVVAPQPIQSNEKKGLLISIMNKLRGAK